jgi:DNA polymerase-3 subunit epsilon
MITDRINFTAVDFETSAWPKASACAVGAVQVRDGKITDSFYSLLKPPNYPYWNYVETHNITRAMVENAPTFPEVWPKLKSILADGPFVAHYASFDWAVLTRTLAYYKLPTFELERICTCRLAQRKCPELPRHDLATVAAHLGIDLNHHQAASDARACAEVAIRLWSE